MTALELARSASTDASPPPELSPAAHALWLAKADRWEEAHDFCQQVPGQPGAWIHAWLHRQEGDLGNAAYWYARASRKMPAESTPLAEEWMEIALELVPGVRGK